VKDRTKCGIGAEGQKLDWDSIDWERAERQVTRLRQRIFRATREQQWNKVRNLMKLMLRSRSNLLLSVRRVTQTNKGKGTPGIDGKIALTNKARTTLIQQMEQAA
jgi:RNA-directed DNA polymerase